MAILHFYRVGVLRCVLLLFFCVHFTEGADAARERRSPSAKARAGTATTSQSAGIVLPEFAFTDYTLSVSDAAGHPVAGAQVYGWCREYNLLWPRPDESEDLAEGRGVEWSEDRLGKTGSDGTIKVSVPKGNWGFVATGQCGNTACVAWSDFRARTAGETIRLVSRIKKQWGFSSANGDVLPANKLYFKPTGFPVWIAASLPVPAAQATVDFAGGTTEMWAAGDAYVDPGTQATTPGFAMSFGTVSASTPDGNLRSPERPALIQCSGSSGRASVEWERYYSPGLDGEVALVSSGTVLLTPGSFAISYKRPVASTLTGQFSPQANSLRPGDTISLNLGGTLAAELDQDRDKFTANKLCARLYVTDVNGHALCDLLDSRGRQLKIEAAVLLNGTRFPAEQKLAKRTFHGNVEDGVTLFEATVAAPLGDKTQWELTGLEGLLPISKFTPVVRTRLIGNTFETAAPSSMAPQVRNVLAQADAIASAMDLITGKKRKLPLTELRVEPGHGGASASHDGKMINYKSSVFLSNDPVSRHTFVHELAHNYGQNHGGLMETVVEATRSYGCEQFTAQMAKWLFFDRMNGIQYREYPYPQVGLYLYCYGIGGQPFLQFLLKYETAVRSKLGHERVTARKVSGLSAHYDDDVTMALLSVALKRDVSRICDAYGLKFDAMQAQVTLRATEGMCKGR